MVAANFDGLGSLTKPLLKDALTKAASGPVLDVLLKDAAESASSLLCSDLGKHWVKAAKAGIPEDGGGSYGCFVGSTPISTPKGVVPIEAIRAGDLVEGFDPKTNTLGTYSVVATTDPLHNPRHLQIRFASRDLTCTPNHPILTPHGFIKAEDLIPGTEICTPNSCERIEEIGEIPGTEPVFNLQVDGARTFVANGVVVHNTTIVEDGEEERPRIMKMSKEDDEDSRSDERKLAEQTVKLGYSVARNLGFDPHTSLFAACYAFTKL
jgi:hypothetical protein